MNADEKVLIENLAQRLQQAELSDIDTDAEKLIQKLMSNQPRAMYLLTQAVLLQEQALKASQEKIKQLEHQVQQAQQTASQKKGGFLSGLFGGSPQPNNHNSAGNQGFTQQNGANYSAPNHAQQPNEYAQPHGNNYRPSRGSSFMGQAASTALGVAGGALLFEGVSHMFGGRGGLGSGFLGNNHETIVDETIINEAPDSNQFSDQNMDTNGWNNPSDSFSSNTDGLTDGNNWADNFSSDQSSDSGFGFDNSSFDNSDFDNGGGFDDGGFGGFDGGGFDDSNW